MIDHAGGQGRYRQTGEQDKVVHALDLGALRSCMDFGQQHGAPGEGKVPADTQKEQREKEMSETVAGQGDNDRAQEKCAAKNDDSPALIHELADLTFHLLVLMAEQNIAPSAIKTELKRRFGTSGLHEKATRHKERY